MSYNYLSSYEIVVAIVLNAIFNTPALVYIGQSMTGNPDLKRLFSSCFLIFPGVMPAIPFVTYLFSYGITGYDGTT